MADKIQDDGVIEFNFPLGGLNESVAYKDQQPNTSALISNCRIRDVSENRARGGQRGGLKKVFTEQGSNKVVLKMITLVNTYIEPE